MSIEPMTKNEVAVAQLGADSLGLVWKRTVKRLVATIRAVRTENKRLRGLLRGLLREAFLLLTKTYADDSDYEEVEVLFEGWEKETRTLLEQWEKARAELKGRKGE